MSDKERIKKVNKDIMDFFTRERYPGYENIGELAEDDMDLSDEIAQEVYDMSMSSKYKLIKQIKKG